VDCERDIYYSESFVVFWIVAKGIAVVDRRIPNEIKIAVFSF
jgi:hypothetical protein